MHEMHPPYTNLDPQLKSLILHGLYSRKRVLRQRAPSFDGINSESLERKRKTPILSAYQLDFDPAIGYNEAADYLREMRSVPLEKKELSLQGGDPSKETKNNDER